MASGKSLGPDPRFPEASAFLPFSFFSRGSCGASWWGQDDITRVEGAAQHLYSAPARWMSLVVLRTFLGVVLIQRRVFLIRWKSVDERSEWCEGAPGERSHAHRWAPVSWNITPLSKGEKWNSTFWKDSWPSERTQRWLFTIGNVNRQSQLPRTWLLHDCGWLRFCFLLTSRRCLWRQLCAGWHQLPPGGKGPECPT